MTTYLGAVWVEGLLGDLKEWCQGLGVVAVWNWYSGDIGRVIDVNAMSLPEVHVMCSYQVGQPLCDVVRKQRPRT